jgi:hypothetical protein
MNEGDWDALELIDDFFCDILLECRPELPEKVRWRLEKGIDRLREWREAHEKGA